MAQFKVGDKVTAKAFTDCFNQFHPAITDLTVSKVYLMEMEYIAPYYRLTANYSNGFMAVEAAERFFEAA